MTLKYLLDLTILFTFLLRYKTFSFIYFGLDFTLEDCLFIASIPLDGITWLCVDSCDKKEKPGVFGSNGVSPHFQQSKGFGCLFGFFATRWCNEYLVFFFKFDIYIKFFKCKLGHIINIQVYHIFLFISGHT